MKPYNKHKVKYSANSWSKDRLHGKVQRLWQKVGETAHVRGTPLLLTWKHFFIRQKTFVLSWKTLFSTENICYWLEEMQKALETEPTDKECICNRDTCCKEQFHATCQKKFTKLSGFAINISFYDPKCSHHP